MKVMGLALDTQQERLARAAEQWLKTRDKLSPRAADDVSASNDRAFFTREGRRVGVDFTPGARRISEVDEFQIRLRGEREGDSVRVTGRVARWNGHDGFHELARGTGIECILIWSAIVGRMAEDVVDEALRCLAR